MADQVIPPDPTPSFFLSPSTCPNSFTTLIHPGAEPQCNPPRMTHKVDLGRSFLCTIDSSLRLHLAASAQFRLPPTHRSSDIPFDMSQWLASDAVWVLPGPQLEFSCHISADPVLEGAIFGLTSLLRDKLCGSKV